MIKYLLIIATLLLLTASAHCQSPPADLPYDVAPWPVDNHRPQPEYPTTATLAGVRGDVTVDVVVDSAGLVRSVTAIREKPDGLGFFVAVESALRCWKFQPAMKSGAPVPALVTMTFSFIPRGCAQGQDAHIDLGKRWIAAMAVSDSTLAEHFYGNKKATYQPPPVLFVGRPLKIDVMR
jgi:TonB family protein